MPRQRIWLSPEALDWEMSLEGGHAFEFQRESTSRPYDLLKHADELLSGGKTRDHLADAILTLNRVAQLRINNLCTTYELRKIPVREKPKDRLELLAFLGIVRPLMLRELIDIRNAVEHEDAPPPDN